MKTATQLKAKSRNLSAATGTPPHIIQRNFLFERFLERAAVSEHRDNFIIKGGMLLTSIMGIDLRATMDLDATLRGRDLSREDVTKLINVIISVKLDDGTEFVLNSVERARVESDYPGWRVSLDVVFDIIKDTLKLDITVGDVITPRAIEYSYKLMFEDRSINVLAYNLETILAEKFAACVSLGTSNTRMKDYYDVHILTQMRGGDIDHAIFAKALARTSAQRHIDLSDSKRVFEEVAENSAMRLGWKRYQKDYAYSADISFADTVKALRTLAEWGGLISEQEKLKADFIGHELTRMYMNEYERI
jgi:predicted nucleotidyltransferase component of viral defense system